MSEPKGESKQQAQRSTGRSRRALVGLVTGYISFVFYSLLRFFITPYFLRVLGPELMGLRAFIAETINYTKMTNFGISSAVTMITAKEYPPSTEGEISPSTLAKLKTGGQMQHLLSVLSIIAAIFVAIFLDKLAKGVPAEHLMMGRAFVLAYGIGMAFFLAGRLYSALLVGRQRFKLTNIVGFVLFGLDGGLGVLLVWLGWSLYGIGLAYVFTNLIVISFLIYYTRREGIILKIFSSGFNREAAPEVLKIGGYLLLSTIGVSLSFESFRFILGINSSMGMVAVNQITLLITVPLMLDGLMTRVLQVLRPGMVELQYSGDNPEKLQDLGILAMKVLGVMTSALIAYTVLLNGHFLKLWVGEEHYAGDMANIFVAIYIATHLWMGGPKILLHIRFEFKRYGISILAAGLISIALMLLLVSRFGISGVLISAVIGELAVILPFVVVHIFRWLTTGRSSILVTLKTVIIPILITVSWLYIGTLIDWRPSTWLGLFIAVSIVMGTCAGIGLLWLYPQIRQYGLLRKLKKS